RRTRAIMPVHLFGLPAKMDAIFEIAQARRLPVIEDAAQSIGSHWRGKATGSLGSLGCFSFFPSKNLGGAGDGGMITTDDSHLAATTSEYSYESVVYLRQFITHTLCTCNPRLLTWRTDSVTSHFLRRPARRCWLFLFIRILLKTSSEQS